MGIAESCIEKTPIELPHDWTGYVDQPLTDGELDRLQTSMQRQTPFGSPPWQMQICGELGLESTLKPKGRPKSGDR
jgi:putative transposase